MVKSLVQHRHCSECGKVCPVEKETCCEDCEVERNKKIRSKRIWYFLFIGMMVVFMAILMIQVI